MFGWQRRLDERKKQFIQKSLSKLTDMDSFLTTLVSSPGDPQALKSVNQHFHQLAGAGGIYEMDEFCELNIAGEEIASRALSAGSAAPLDVEKMRAIVNAVRNNLANCNHQPSAELGAAASGTPDDSLQALGRLPGLKNDAPIDVLIAVDDVETLHGLHRLCEEMKMVVRTVRSGSGAKGALLTRMPDAMIVSTPLGDLSAYDLVAGMRGIPGGAKPVVAMLSQQSGFLNKVMAIRAGVDAFFDHPIDSKTIVEQVKHLVDREKPEQYKILSVEDDYEQAEFIKDTLSSAGYTVFHIADPGKFEQSLLSTLPDLILLDVMLGDINGFELARFVRQHERFAAVPIIFLTTQNQLVAHIESAPAGGDDHLIKPIAPQLLVAAIAGRLERYSLLRQLIGKDGLTECLTFAAFMQQATKFANTGAKKHPISMVCFDIDKLEAINERFGFVAGERAIAGLASVLRKTFRQTEVIGRVSGDSIAVIVEHLSEDELLDLCAQLLSEYATIEHRHDQHKFRITASAGIVALEGGMDARHWLAHAVAATRSAKDKGGNQASVRKSTISQKG